MKFGCTMSKNSGKVEYNGIFERGHDFDATFKWKISNISSIPHKVDYVVHSPSFFYEGASWIFKMYPCGRSSCTEGYIDFGIERLDSEMDKHVISCKIYCENNFDVDFNSSGRYVFNSTETEAKISRVMQNLKECPIKWQFAPNDVFTVVFAFCTDDVVPKVKSDETVVGKTYAASRNTECQETGEVFRDCFNLKCFLWKICGLPSFILPADYQLDSPTFSFANATWILKLYPYFRNPQSRNPEFCVILQRLHSEVPEHYITLRMRINHPTENDAIGFSFFNIHHTDGNRLNFRLKEADLLKIAAINKCLHYDVYISVDNIIKKDVKTEMNSLAKCTKPRVDDSGSSVVHQNNKVLKDYKELFRQKEDCDVIIKVKGVEIPAHRIILKARSPVLASTFRTDMKEKATGVVDVEDCDPNTFSDFLSFLYCGELKSLSADNVFSLFTTADKYDVADLRTMCLEFMKENLSVDTFCDIVALALQHSEAELIKLSTDFFSKNLQEIIVTVKWQSFVIENPIQGNELMIKALVPSKNKNTNS